MERPIDRHTVRKSNSRGPSLSKINQWRDAWIACYQIVEHLQNADIKRFHTIFEKWVPILNYIFHKPIANLERYQAKFYYLNEPNGPKEVIQLYIEENPFEELTLVYVIFNLYEFNLIHQQFCLNMSKSNQMLVDQGKGTINLLCLNEYETNPADYFKLMTCWHLLFIYTLHALAHWETYDKYEHAHYDTHTYLRDSPFFKIFYYGHLTYK